MSTEKLASLVKALKSEISKVAADDASLIDLADQLDADVEKYIISKDEPESAMQDTLLAIESQLSARHPVATKITEEIISILSNMGI